MNEFCYAGLFEGACSRRDLSNNNVDMCWLTAILAHEGMEKGDHHIDFEPEFTGSDVLKM